jgi:Tfp pilus assembly protein PilF
MNRALSFLAALLSAATAQAQAPAKEPAKEPAKRGAAEAELAPAQVEARALVQQAIACFQGRDLAKATELAARAATLDAKYELALRVQGWCATAKGDDAKAAELLTRALNLEPENGDVEFLLASCHRRLGEWGAARDLLDDLARKQGATVALLVELSECAAGEKDLVGALGFVAQARLLDPKERSLVERAIALHERRRDWAAAVREIEPLLAAAPAEVALRWRLVSCRIEGQQWPEAIAALEEAARLWKDDPQPHRVLAEIHANRLPDPEKLAVEQEWLKAWNLRRR